MGIQAESRLIDTVRKSAHRIKDAGDDYTALLEVVGDAPIVLLGEATHGSHEFYKERAEITKQLIQKKGFKAVAIEGDWPDAYRVHQYVTGQGQDMEASDALSGFTRFPSWMWMNADMLNFVGWLREYNDGIQAGASPVGFYGLDLYSLFRSAREVIDYLQSIDPTAADRAKSRFACLERFGGDSQNYAYAAALGLTLTCEEAVVEQLMDLLKCGSAYRHQPNGGIADERYFNAEQNSRLVAAAENYYRTMLHQNISSWNLRDQHMAETLEHIRQHIIRRGDLPKVVVWAHNSHLGDSSATEMVQRGEFNIGQLAKEAYGREVVSIGFTTYHGTVTAASTWDGPPERKTIIPALDSSYESIFHKCGIPRFFLSLGRETEAAQALRAPLLERAIGVLYKPESERQSHYFQASLPLQFDGIIHIDRTRAVEPIEHKTIWNQIDEVPESYPTGL